MAETAPVVRTDAAWGEDAELYVTEQVLYRLADMVNAATKAGRLYGQLLLGPEEALAKRNAMQGAQS